MENSNGNKVLVLRTCASDMSAYGGFIWPKSGFVEAPDWKPQAECGNGLHGLLWGQGSSGYLSDAEDANWMVCEVEKDTIVDLEDKVKFPSCEVVFCGEKEGAISYLMENGGRGYAIVYSTLTGGENATLIVKRWNGKRYKMHIAYVGEDGIKEGVKYRLNDDNEFVEVEDE